MKSNHNITPVHYKTYKPFVAILRRPSYRTLSPNVNSLPNDDNMKTLYETLNDKANEDYKNYVKSTLVQWKPVKKYASILSSRTNQELELLFMFYRRYVPPLESFEKPFIRAKLMNFFNNSTTDEERRFYHSLLDYYELIEDMI